VWWCGVVGSGVPSTPDKKPDYTGGCYGEF